MNYKIEILGLVPSAQVRIYNLGDLVNPIWIGITDINGRAVDIYGNLPNLNYGNYRTSVEKCDYDTLAFDFNVPESTVLNLTLGCSSALETHRLSDVHTQGQPPQIHDNMMHNIQKRTFPEPITNQWTNEENIDSLDWRNSTYSQGNGIFDLIYDFGTVKTFSLFIMGSSYCGDTAGVSPSTTNYISVSNNNVEYIDILIHGKSGLQSSDSVNAFLYTSGRYLRFRHTGSSTYGMTGFEVRKAVLVY